MRAYYINCLACLNECLYKLKRKRVLDHISKNLDISCEVPPQRTLFGSLLFIVFINDLLKIIANSNMKLY